MVQAIITMTASTYIEFGMSAQHIYSSKIMVNNAIIITFIADIVEHFLSKCLVGFFI